MQKKHLTLVLLFVSTILLSQDFEKVWEIERHSKVDAVEYSEIDSSWIIIGSQEFVFESDIFISKLNHEGQEIWSTTENNNYSLVKISDIEVNSSGEIYFLAESHSACGGYTGKSALYKYSPNGHFISKKEFPYQTLLKDMLLIDEAYIAITLDNFIQLFDTSYNQLWQRTIVNSNLSNKIQMSSDTQLIVFDDGVIWKLDLFNVFITDSIATNTVYENVLQKDGWFYLLDSSGQITQMDDDLNFSSQSFNINPITEVHQWKMLPNGNSVLLGKQNNYPLIKTLDSNFVEINTTSLNDEYAFIANVEVGTQGLMIGGCTFASDGDFTNYNFDDFVGGTLDGFNDPFIKTLDFNLQSNDTLNDARIISFTSDTIISRWEDCYYGSNHPYYSVDAPKFLIQNEGTAPIHSLSFQLSWNITCAPMWTCYEEYQRAFTYQIDNLNIQPNTTAFVTIPDFYLEETNHMDVYIKSINQKLDNDFSDNYYDLTFDYPVVDTGGGSGGAGSGGGSGSGGSGGNTTTPNTISIYPNPAQDFITIEVVDDVESLDYQIYNALYQPVLQRNNINTRVQKTHRVDIRQLQTGYYILKFQTDYRGLEFTGAFIKH